MQDSRESPIHRLLGGTLQVVVVYPKSKCMGMTIIPKDKYPIEGFIP